MNFTIRTFIALFRGINVGGKNSLPMKSLVHALQDMGIMNIKTYIQSGNVIFQCDKADKAELFDRIGKQIADRFGFRPQIILLTVDELRKAIRDNPYPEAGIEPKSMHLYFLKSPPENPDFKLLESLQSRCEQFQLINSVFYLHAPDGIGRSKLAAHVEKGLGVHATARNWRTVTQLMSMAERTEKS